MDHPGARSARAHLQEDPHAIVIRLAHGLREVHSLDRLGQEGIGRPVLIDLVRFTPGSAVETRVLRRAGVQHMQVAVRLRYRVGDLAMDRRDALQSVEWASEQFDGLLHRRCVATDDTFVRRVDDEQVDPVELRNDLARPIGRRLDHAHAPLHRRVLGDAPGCPRSVTASGQFADEQLAFRHTSEHLVPLMPGAMREQAGGLAQRVANHRLGPDAEACHQIRRDGA